MDNFENLIDLFIFWNSRINLSGIRDPDQIYKKHILDSLEILNEDFINFFNLKEFYSNNLTLIDVGFGGGFPLLPLAISKPYRNFIGIESIRKKVNAVQDIVNKLNLKNVYLINNRSEKVSYKGDIVTVRAVAYITKLLPQIIHLVKDEGYIFLYKIPSSSEKIDLILQNIYLEGIWQYKINNYRRIYVLKPKKFHA